MADYDSQTQELTVADTNPKKYTRYWKCPAKRMYDACVDRDTGSTRPRGMLVVRKLETVTPAATAPTAATGRPAASTPAVVWSPPLVAPEKPAD